VTVRFRFVADDYGESRQSNLSILELCSTEIVHSATVLAAAQCVYTTGYELKRSDIFWGAHLYLTEYPPLTDAMLEYYYKRTPVTKMAILADLLTGKLSLGIILKEFDEQMERLLNCGFPVAFIDTHQNIHGIPLIYGIVKDVAKKHRISYDEIRPINQLSFTPGFNIRTLLSSLYSGYLGLASEKKVLFNCPCYRKAELDQEAALAAWEKFIVELNPVTTGELHIPCHPGTSPAEAQLYSSNNFANLLKFHCIQTF